MKYARMGGVLSRLPLRIFELLNELFIGVASGVAGIIVLTAKGLSDAHYVRTIFVVALTAGCLIYTFQSSELIEPSFDKIVCVTGCDSGLGYSLAQHISSLGFTVVAGCLKLNSKGAKELKKNSRIIVVELDITNDSNVQTVVETITKYLESRKYSKYVFVF